MPITIGIRELRQNASKYLRRVRAGETITITDRGEPFAEIRPTAPAGGILERLIADGRAGPASGRLSEYLSEHRPRAAEPDEPLLSDVVIAMREEERP